MDEEEVEMQRKAEIETMKARNDLLEQQAKSELLMTGEKESGQQQVREMPIDDPERIAMAKEEAQNKFAYIVKRAKKLDKQGNPKQCGTHLLIFDIDGKDLPVHTIMAIRKEYGKIVAAEPLAIIVDQALKMKLRSESVTREEYIKQLQEQLKAVQSAKSPGVLPRGNAGPQEGGGITVGEVKTNE